MSKRYVAVGLPSLLAVHTPSGRDGIEVRIEVTEQDIRDTKTGHVYQGGRRTVRCKGARTRSWDGETAWMSSERYAYDLVTAVSYDRPIDQVR